MQGFSEANSFFKSFTGHHFVVCLKSCLLKKKHLHIFLVFKLREVWKLISRELWKLFLSILPSINVISRKNFKCNGFQPCSHALNLLCFQWLYKYTKIGWKWLDKLFSGRKNIFLNTFQTHYNWITKINTNENGYGGYYFLCDSFQDSQTP